MSASMRTKEEAGDIHMAEHTKIQALKGTWTYVSEKNFDEFLKELGVNKIIRTVAKTVKPRLIIEENGDKWIYRQESTFKNMSFTFVPGVQFEDTTPMGDKMDVVIGFENGIWKQNVHYHNGKDVVVQRWIDEQDQLQTTMKCGNITAVQVFRRAT